MLNDRLAGLIGVAESADARPTDQSEAVFARLGAQLDAELTKMNRLLDAELPVLNTRLRQASMPAIVRRPPASGAGAPSIAVT